MCLELYENNLITYVVSMKKISIFSISLEYCYKCNLALIIEVIGVHLHLRKSDYYSLVSIAYKIKGRQM